MFWDRPHRNGTKATHYGLREQARGLHSFAALSYRGLKLYRDFLLAVFAILAGFTASGILANLYRLIAHKPRTTAGQLGYVAVMVVAGPNVLLENAARSLRAKDCSRFAFWLAASIAAYWSFALGMIVIQVSLSV